MLLLLMMSHLIQRRPRDRRSFGKVGPETQILNALAELEILESMNTRIKMRRGRHSVMGRWAGNGRQIAQSGTGWDDGRRSGTLSSLELDTPVP